MHDLILKNGRVIDPSQGLDSIADVAFADGKVAAVGASLPADAREIQDVSGRIVTPGLIDLHTHVYWGGTSIGVDPDAIADQSGCTTLVDAGTAGAANILGFRRHVIEPAKTRVLAYLNLSFPGIFAFSKNVMVGECSDLRLLDARECARVVNEHRDLVLGIKVRVGAVAGGNSGIGPMEIAVEVADQLQMPVMAHLDLPPPGREDVVSRLRPGDVLTHCFRPFPNAPVGGTGRIHEDILAARQRGVFFDIGHGMGSFGFGTARAMLSHGFLPDTISSDVHSLCIDGPAYDLLVTMSKFLNLGVSLTEIIARTTHLPAKVIGRSELGTLTVGATGDASVLRLESGEYEFEDSMGELITGPQRLFSLGRVMSGVWHPRATKS
ncbi:MAG: amidohydrolase/deacetylase family metallohydrolase [bacterium]|nr:amidohydrolase/deacetylase family metallohydrolase [bacterium]